MQYGEEAATHLTPLGLLASGWMDEIVDSLEHTGRRMHIYVDVDGERG